MDKYEKITGKKQLALIKRLLGYTKPYYKLIIVSFIFVLIATYLDVLLPVISKTIIDKYFRVSNFDLNGVMFYAAIFFGVNILNSIFRFAHSYMFKEVGNKVVKTIRVDLYKKLQNLGMRYFDQTPVGSIVSRVTNDTEAILEMLNNVLAVVFSSLIAIVGVLIAMFNLNPLITLICIMFIPIELLLIATYQKLSTKFYQAGREKLSQLNTKLSESIVGMNIIQDFNQQKRLIKEFEKTNDEYYQASIKNIKLNGLLLSTAVDLIGSMCMAALLISMGIESFTGVVTAGMIMAFSEYIFKFTNPVLQIMERLAIYQQALVACQRIFGIMDNNEEIPKQSDEANAIIKDAKIEFKNVTFSYDGKNEVLKDISFEVNPGETVALVGHTGSGKSSIINVIMRFYEFYQGEILIDGVSIRDYSYEELRAKTGLVLQDPFIYYGTIKDNVSLNDDRFSDEQIRKACEFVQADTFINELSDTYNHKVIERGAAFSSGQRQLIAFARTIITNPKILILDEATANIDSETEKLIQEGLERMRRGRTTIAIAHRLSTIKDANQILVLDKGRIIERGTHEELVSLGGVYNAMYELQQKGMDI